MVDITIRDIPENSLAAIEAAAAERGLEPGEFMRQEMEKNLRNEQRVFTPLSFLKLAELEALPPPESESEPADDADSPKVDQDPGSGSTRDSS